MKKDVGRFAVRVHRATMMSPRVEIFHADTDESLWRGLMGDGVIEAMGKRQTVFFFAVWKTEDLLILREEIENRTR